MTMGSGNIELQIHATLLLLKNQQSLYSLRSNFNSDWILQTCSLEFGNFSSHSSTEKHRGSISRNGLQELIDDGTEIHIQQTIGLVHNLGTREWEEGKRVRIVSYLLRLVLRRCCFCAPSFRSSQISLKAWLD